MCTWLVPASEIVAANLARDRSGSKPDATPEQLAAWRTDPAICAHLSSLRALHLGGQEGIAWCFHGQAANRSSTHGITLYDDGAKLLERMPGLRDLTIDREDGLIPWGTLLGLTAGGHSAT